MDDSQLVAFVEFTGATLEQAETYLTVSDGNLEQAIALYHENGGADLLGGGASTTSTSTSRGPPAGPMFDDDVRQPIAQKTDVLVGGYDDDYDMGGFNPSSHIIRPSFSGSSSSRRTHLRSAFTNVSPTAMSSEKASRLAELFAPPTDLMFPGSFDEARETAMRKQKWLMVTISDSTEFQCEAMKRDIWRIPNIKGVIRENFIFALYASDSPEGRNHRTFYPYSSYPYVAIIDPRTGERVKSWNSLPTAESFLQDVTEFLDTNDLKDFQRKFKKETSSKVTDLSEEEQLKFALKQSMMESGGSSSQAKGKVQSAPEPILVEDGTPEEAWLSIIPLTSPEPSAGDVTRIQFRLPDGSRVVRKFLKTDKVICLFQFAKAAMPNNDKRFELINVRDPLYGKLDMTLVDAKVVNSSLTLELADT